MENEKKILHSYLLIRKIIGLLGISLPIIVVAFYGGLLSSLSHYYYTKSAVFFIAILSAFGLFLISYKGYERDKETEKLSDNVITHIGGFAILLVVFFPTSCTDSGLDLINNFCESGAFPLFGHCNKILSAIHLVSAGIFLFAMGWMSYFRFTKGKLTKKKKRKNTFYRISAYIIWGSIAILLIEFVASQFGKNLQFSDYDVFIFETVSIFAFGISWLIKGKTVEDILSFKNSFSD